jgi:hypothetical protein
VQSWTLKQFTNNDNISSGRVTWNPSGTEIALSATINNGNYQIYKGAFTPSAPLGALSALTNHSDGTMDTYPDWGQNGIVYLEQPLSGQQRIKLVGNPPGFTLTAPTPPSGLTFAGGLAWSPNGTQVAYALGSPTASTYIYYFNAADGIPVQITTGSVTDAWPDWAVASDNTQWIFFQRISANTPQIYRVQVNPLGQPQLLTGSTGGSGSSTPSVANPVTYLAAVFPPPMDVPLPRLSNCEFADRQGANVRSRDINPSIPGNYPLIASAPAEVMIVDTSLAADPPPLNNANNAGLGNFVAIRINWTNLPKEIQDRINSKYFSANPVTSGYLYIGYAHLQSVAVSAVAPPNPSPQVPLKGAIGVSGDTGDAGIKHLDITVFYIPPKGPFNVRPEPSSTGYDTSPYSFANLHQWYNAFYRLYNSRETFGNTQEIDPLVLWPILAQGTSCPLP